MQIQKAQITTGAQPEHRQSAVHFQLVEELRSPESDAISGQPVKELQMISLTHCHLSVTYIIWLLGNEDVVCFCPIAYFLEW